MSDLPLTGGCQCGAVRFRVEGEPGRASICHCRMCQKAFAGPFGALVTVAVAGLAWTRGAPARFQSSDTVRRGFCHGCGTPLFFRYVEMDRIAVSIGSLDDPRGIFPEKQYGIESRLPAFATLADLPGETTAEGTAPEFRATLVSRQHPDHD